METININGINFIIITRPDGSKLSVEANENNPEYAYLLRKMQESN